MSTTFVRIEGNEYHMRKGLRDLKDRVKTLVNGKKTQIFVEVPDSELGWLEKVTKDIGLSTISIPTMPHYDPAPCGVLTTDLMHHTLRCKKCIKATGRIKKERHTSIVGPVQRIAKVPGLKTLDMKSLIALYKQRMEECLTLAQMYDSAIKALEGMETVDKRLAEIQKEKEEHKKALELFLH